jgi:hypothetical protein
MRTLAPGASEIPRVAKHVSKEGAGGREAPRRGGYQLMPVKDRASTPRSRVKGIGMSWRP